MAKYVIDIQQNNASWYTQEADTHNEAYAIIDALDDTQLVIVNGVEVTAESELNAWMRIERQRAEIETHKQSKAANQAAGNIATVTFGNKYSDPHWYYTVINLAGERISEQGLKFATKKAAVAALKGAFPGATVVTTAAQFRMFQMSREYRGDNS